MTTIRQKPSQCGARWAGLGELPCSPSTKRPKRIRLYNTVECDSPALPVDLSGCGERSLSLIQSKVPDYLRALVPARARGEWQRSRPGEQASGAIYLAKPLSSQCLSALATW